MNEPGQRYDPVGSSNDSDTIVAQSDREHFQHLEKEQEKLSTSLQALTSHFAQVQFRLRQIINAPEQEKSHLIENLDEFASRGICHEPGDCTLTTLNEQQVSQFELIKKLQMELSAARNFAGEEEIDLEIDSPCIVNDESVIDNTDANLSHLKSQIYNLDAFVTDLRYEAINLKQMTDAMEGYRTCNSLYNVNVHSMKSTCQSLCDDDDDFMSKAVRKKPLSALKRYEQPLNDVRQRPSTVYERPSTNSIKHSSPKVVHWGHIRAKLEIDVQNIISAVSIQPFETHQIEQQNDTKLITQKEVAKMVRKELCGTLRELIEHGLRPSSGYELNFFRCCIRRPDKRIESKWNGKHAWDIIMEFYNLNDGNRHYQMPFNTLSESFRLNCMSIVSIREMLLKAIGDVINIHVRSNASKNAYFKAFIVLGLNLKMLPHWLGIIFKCSDLIETNYLNESLVRQPEFADIRECLDLLSKYDLNLSVETLADRCNKIDHGIFN